MAVLAIWSSFWHQTPIWDVIPKIWFFLHRWLALWWKNFVFLSPASNQIDLNLCCQQTSSWWRSSLISFFSALIVGWFAGLFCKANSSKVDYFSWILVLKFPTVFRLHPNKACLHRLIFSNSRYIGLLAPLSTSQVARIIASQPS